MNDESGNTSMRDAFEAAFEKHDGDLHPTDREMDGDTLASNTDQAIGEAKEPAVSPEIGEDLTKKAEKPAETAPKIDGETPQTEKAGAKPKADDSPAPSEKAPASWGAKSREVWKDVPATAQAEVMKREREVDKVLRESATARRAAESLNAVLAPYQDGLQQAGYADPFTALSTILATENSLRSGTAEQRALATAQLIRQYGVDISMLDSVLAGEAAQAADPQASRLEQLLEERLAPVNQMMQQMTAQQQQAQQADQVNAQQTVEDFAANAEFIEDVRMDMADLLDLAAQRGQPMTIEEAYDKACAINPQVSAVMAERQKQQQIMGTAAQTAAKKAAAASITGTQGGTGAPATDLSLRDQIAQAWNSQTG